MNLPVVDVFQPPYEIYNTQKATLEEMLAPGKLILDVSGDPELSISTAHDAANHMAKVGIDDRLSHFVKNALDNSPSYKAWRKAMPSSTPPELSRYQKHYQNCDLDKVSKVINEVGRVLGEGQFLYHGGRWNGLYSYSMIRPFSTSLCPQIALINGNHAGKAFKDDRIDLLVLRVTNPKVKAFVFKPNGTTHGHELEVLFSAGAELTLRSETLVRADYPVGISGYSCRYIPIYVLEVDIS